MDFPAHSSPVKVCKISGLPITRKPEWTNVRCGDDYRVNLSLLGSQIIISQPTGSIQLQGIKKFLDLVDRVVSEAIPADQSYIIIEDFLNLRRTSLEARRFFINGMKNRRQLAGVVFCNTSSLFKVSVKLGKRLYKGRGVVKLTNDYSRAVKLGMDILSNNNREPADVAVATPVRAGKVRKAGEPHAIIKNEDWILNVDGFTTRMEIIDQKILHSVSAGSLTAKHVGLIANLRHEVQNAISPENGIEYIVADVGNLKGGNRAFRKLYMDSLKQWNQEYPLSMYVLYGANRFTRAASHLAGPFLPFKIRPAGSLEEALAIVVKDQRERKTRYLQTKSASHPPAEDQIRQYVEELLGYLGTIDWERNGMNDRRKPDASHPFSPVFEAIALIKGELDELIQDRNAAEDALRKVKDGLEIKVRERTLEIEKANKELKAEIKERKNTQAELLNAKQAAERANRAKSEFLANMSHELRTPLNHIMGFTELVLDKNFGELNEIQEEYLTDVHHSSKHLLSLINDILDLSKVEAKKVKLELSRVDLPALLENSTEMVRLNAVKHSVQISLNLNNAPKMVTADDRKLKQIMYNLLSNAVKFTPQGGMISVTAQQCGPAGNPDPAAHACPDGGVKISVSDTGIGLRREDLDRIFNPFEQMENSASRRFQGTGLGLSLTKSFVELHGGEVWAESPGEGEGSTFHFILPARPSGTVG